MTFKQLKTNFYPEVNMTVEIYEHIKTGALHYHTVYDTIQNSFNVVFQTLPSSSNGVAHILEHSVLNGSKKYPMNGVFFAMQGRNFETFSNAMTGFDSTQYPFSTIDKQGYFNLLDVYLDAVFFPNLEKEVFLQEGWRYTFKNPEDINSPLEYTGVVYNEMKGEYSNPDRIVFMEMLKQGFANTQYQHSSGGNPTEIPNLSYEDFVQFHQTYYHPSNAVFYTFGSIPAKDIQEKLEELALKHFDKRNIDKKIDIEQLNISGQEYIASHPAEKGKILLKTYQIKDIKSVEEMNEIQLLLNLIQSGKNDIKDFFLQKDIGANIQGVGLLPLCKSVIYLSCKMDQDNEDVIDELLIDYFKQLKLNGISSIELENIFDSIELEVREGEAGANNLGISIISQYVNAKKLGVENIEDINNLTILKEVKAKFLQVGYINNLIDKLFLNNTKTFELISKADPLYVQQLENQIQLQLKEAEVILSDEKKHQIIKQNKDLEVLRMKEKDLSLLPKLTLKDITVKYPEDIAHQEYQISNATVLSFNEEEKGVTYVKLSYPLQQQSEEEIYFQKLMLDIINHLNIKNMTLEETSLWKETKIGMLNIGLALMPQKNDAFKAQVFVDLKGLKENTQKILEKALIFTKDISFDNKELIKSNILNLWRKHLTSYQNNSHGIAITYSQSRLSNLMALKKKITLDYKVKFLPSIIKKIESGDDSFINELVKAYEKIFSVAPTIFFCGDKQSEKIMLKNLESYSFGKKENEELTYQKENEEHLLALDLQIPINHVAYSIPVASADEEDGGKLKLLAAYIQPYLLTNIREKGGAYGANASYSNDGIFTLYSYRDPNSLNTVKVFEEIANFMLENEIDEEELNVNKLNLIKAFSKPQETIQKANRQFNKLMNEQGSNEKLLIDSILNTQPNDLKDMVKKYFMNKNAFIAIATNERTIREDLIGWSSEIIN